MKTTKNTLNNENGMIMVAVLMILVIITILALSASRTAVIEMQIATNESQAVNEFYNAERGLINTLETSGTWMDDAFLSANPTDPAATSTGNVDFNGDGVDDARMEVRCIENTMAPAVVPVPGISAAANNVPVIQHIGPPPAGSGYSSDLFEVRRYAVTATSLTGNTQVQAGVWMVFNTFNN